MAKKKAIPEERSSAFYMTLFKELGGMTGNRRRARAKLDAVLQDAAPKVKKASAPAFAKKRNGKHDRKPIVKLDRVASTVFNT